MLDAGGCFKMIALYAAGQPIFSEPAGDAHEAPRAALRASLEPIAIFEARGDITVKPGQVTRAHTLIGGPRNLLPVLDAADMWWGQLERKKIKTANAA